MNKNNNSKKVLLILVGMSDTFCDVQSKRYLPPTEKTIASLNSILGKHVSTIDGIVSVNSPGDTFKTVNYKHPVHTKNIKFSLCTKNFLAQYNSFEVKSSVDDDHLVMNGDQFDYLFNPDDYEIHLAGVDIYGIFVPIISELKEAGFDITVYSDAIRPFNRSVVDHIKEHCTYTSAQTALGNKRHLV